MWTVLREPGTRAYVVLTALLALAYAVLVPVLWATRPVEDGPLVPTAPAAEVAPQIVTACEEVTNLTADERDEYTLRIVTGVVDGATYHGCYRFTEATGSVFSAGVVDENGFEVRDDRLLQRSGAWPWMGLIKTPGEAVGGFAALLSIALVYYLYYRRPQPGPPRRWTPWSNRLVDVVLGAVPVLGWIVLWLLPGRSKARRRRVILQGVIWLLSLVLFSCFVTWTDTGADRLGGWVLLLTVLTVLLGWWGGLAWLRPVGWGRPDDAPPGQPQPVSWAPAPAPVPAAPVPAASAAAPAPAGSPNAEKAAGQFRITPAAELQDFRDVGGMEDLKAELRDTVGLLLAFDREAAALRIDFNGILLHGPPGVGKTFVAQATAGEFGLNLLKVSVADLVSSYVGETARTIAACFATAAANVPVLLLFDEFDAIAGRREDAVGEESRRSVNQLLQSLEAYRSVRSLVVMAATNHLDQLDPAVIRPGRFDRRVRVDLPDETARRAVLAAQLEGRAVGDDVDLPDLARRTAGLTPAALAGIVDTAALTALRATAAGGELVAITHTHLRAALQSRGGKDRPTVERHGFDRLILEPAILAELRQLKLLLTDPDTAARYGIEPPSGVLLTGPPGTGKTSIARALAAEAGCSFYAITTADLTSKWVGESEQNIRRLFERAREHAPSIVFLDEVDGIAARRGGGVTGDERLLSQLLAEIDGMAGNQRVFVLAATNRPDVLDPALTRGGRLSRRLEIGLPDGAARVQLLALFSGPMPLDPDVDLDLLAAQTDGWAGADLEALCQQAAVAALIRNGAAEEPAVTAADFQAALVDLNRATDSGRLRFPGQDLRPLEHR